MWRVLMRHLNKHRNSQDARQQGYFPLTPSDSAEGIETYCKALDCALDDSNVVNIAVTGRYGAGKSTFLRTYFRERHDVLWISLASFLDGRRDAPETAASGDVPNGDEGAVHETRKERLLEFSIIQQLFYKATNLDLPLSRFKKLSIRGVPSIIVIYFGLMVSLIAMLGMVQPQMFTRHLNDAVRLTLVGKQNMIFWMSCLGAVALASLSVKWLIGYVRGGGSVRINLEKVEVGLEKSGSIFNRYLDEMVYFFEKMDYRVVIFEDLDRFGDLQIFTKLREINLLLNQSKQIPAAKKPIRFIYALRDDVFINKDKVKFFEFLIPIIPIINASNSDGVLLNFLQQVKIADDSVRSVAKAIAPYVSDMRLLKNVVNEFAIYRKMIPDCARADSLFAMVIFKNFFPSEFAKLHEGSGLLIDVMKEKQKRKDLQVEKVKSEISTCMGLLKSIQDSVALDAHELNMMYLGAALRCQRGIHQVIIDGRWGSLLDASDEKLSRVFGRDLEGNGTVRWRTVEQCVNQQVSYAEHRKLIENKGIEKESAVKEKIHELKRSLVDVHRLSAKDAIERGCLVRADIDGYLTAYQEDERSLFWALIAGGYLAEDYAHYISVFQAGRLSRSDYYFKVNVMKGQPGEWDDHLDCVEELVSDLDSQYFSSPVTLNFSVFECLLSLGGPKLDAYLGMLTKSGCVQFDFIADYLAGRSDLEDKRSAFACVLGSSPSYMDDLVGQSDFTDQRIREQLSLFLWVYNHDEDMVLSESLVAYISEFELLPQALSEIGVDALEKVEVFLRRSGVRMRSVSLDCKGMRVFAEGLLATSAYELSYRMITSILSAHQCDVRDFECRGYSLIKKSGLQGLIDYVDSNFGTFLSDVYFVRETSKCEDADIIRQLLCDQRPGILLADKRRFIGSQSEGCRLTDLEPVRSVEILKLVLDEEFIVPNWRNVLWCFEYWDQLSPELTRYLNKERVVDQLKDSREALEWEDVSSFAMAIACSDTISEPSAYAILSMLPGGRLTDYDGTNATPQRVDTLRRSRRIALTPALCSKMRSYENGSHIVLLSVFPAEFERKYSEFCVNSDDVLPLIEAVAQVHRQSLLSYMNLLADLVNGAGDAVKEGVAKFVSCDNVSNVSPVFLRACFRWIAPNFVQCMALMRIAEDRDDAIELLAMMRDHEYAQLASLGSRPTLHKWDGLKEFIERLKGFDIVSSITEESDGRIRVNTKMS